MKAAEGSSRVLITMPPDVRQWLEQTARYNGGTLSGEAVRALRERMKRDIKQQPAKTDAAAAE